MKKTSAICPQCGDEFWYYPSAYPDKPKIHCSVKCMSNSRWLIGPCPWCGKEFRCRKRAPTTCCSKTCARRMANQNKHVTFNCDNCGVEITRKLSDYRLAKDNHFCSRKCWGKWLELNPPAASMMRRECRVERTCKECGKTFEIIPSALHRQTRKCGQFCARQCAARWLGKNRECKLKPAQFGANNVNWKGGHHKYYGPSWRPQRNAARKRDQYTCQKCGITEMDLGKELDVHHIRPFREFGLAHHMEANHLDNLVSLCFLCHKIIEPTGCTKPTA